MSNSEKTCVIDCRVSSTKQQSGGGLDDQKAICLNFVNSRGWKTLRIFSKVFSGRAEERGDFEEILDYIKEQKKKGISVGYYVVKSLDRFTRDGAITFSEMKDRLNFLGVILADTVGIVQPEQNTLEHVGFSYKWSKRSPTATAQLMEVQRAKDEVTDILTRMVGAEIRLVQEGYKVRPPTDGFINKRILVDGKKKMIEVPDPERADFFRTMFELRAKGIDDKEIVSRVNAMGYKTKTRNRWGAKKTKVIATDGGKPLTVKRLQRIIQRPIYAGVKVEKWTHYNPIWAKYDGLVSITTFNEANRGKVYIKASDDGSLQLLYDYSPFGKVRPKRLRNNPDFRYKFFPCPICRKWMLGSRSRGKLGVLYPAYHCGGFSSGERAHKYIRFPKDEYEKEIRGFVDALEFSDAMTAGLETVLNDVYRMREKEIIEQSSLISQNVGALKAQQANAIETLTTTQSPVARKKLEEKIDGLERQIQEAQGQRDEIEVTERDIKAFVKAVKTIMEHPAEILVDTDDMRAQQTLFGLVFEEMPTYQEITNGTPKLSLAFKLSEGYLNSKTQSVTPRGVEPRLTD